jgi:hypothetical protein
MDLRIRSTGIPDNSPYTIAPTNRAKNGWISYLTMAIRMSANANRIISRVNMAGYGLDRFKLKQKRN